MLGGQGSRPSVAYRHFAPSLSWLASAVLAVSGLAVASAVVVFALASALGFAFRKLTLAFDRSLGEGAKDLCQHATPLYGLEPLGPSTNFANLVYSLVGSLDSASTYVPAYKARTPITRALGWETTFAAPTLNGWASALLTQNTCAPSFRSYLGEWRRLADQPLLSPASYSPQGYVQTSRSPLVPSNPKASAGEIGPGAFGGTGLSTPNGANSYSLYLSAPWVF